MRRLFLAALLALHPLVALAQGIGGFTGYVGGGFGAAPTGWLANPQLRITDITNTGVAQFGTITPGSGGATISGTVAQTSCPGAGAGCVCIATDVSGCSVNTLIFGSAHGLTTGQRVTATSSGTLPTGSGALALTSAVPNFVCVVDTVTIRLYKTKEGAYNNPCQTTSDIVYTNTGSGTLTITVRDNTIVSDVPLTVKSGTAGSGATALFYLSNGAVLDLMLQQPGSGYDTTTVLEADLSAYSITGFEVPVAAVGIAASRTSATTPAIVMLSASGISTTGGAWAQGSFGPIKPWEDLHHTWDCGGDVETITRPTDGASVDANTAQTGPNVVCIWHTSGKKTVTLTSTGISYGGTVVTKTTTKEINVSAFSATGANERFFCPGDPATGETGLSTTDCWTSAVTTTNPSGTTFAAWLCGTSGTSNNTDRVAHVKRGTAFTSGTNGVVCQAGGTRLRVDDCIDSACSSRWGSGANPSFSGSWSISPIWIIMNNSTDNFDDIVISNIDITNNTAQGCYTASYDPDMFSFSSATQFKNIYLYNVSCTMGNTTNPSSVWGGRNNIGYYKGNMTFTVDPSASATSLMAGNAQNWYFLLGVNFSGTSTVGTFSHAYYGSSTTYAPCHFQLMRWNSITNALIREDALKLRIDAGCEKVQGDGNAIEEITNGLAFSPDKQGFGIDSAVEGFICENQSTSSMNTANTARSCFQDAGTAFQSATLRFNRAWDGAGRGTVTNQFSAAVGFSQTAHVRFYGNRMYTNTATLPIMSMPNSPNSFFSGTSCVMTAPYIACGPFTKPSIITDNIFRGPTANAGIYYTVPTRLQTAGTLFARNKYSTQTANPFLNSGDPTPTGATSYSWATWQGFGFDTTALGSTFDATGACPFASCAPASWADMNNP